MVEAASVSMACPICGGPGGSDASESPSTVCDECDSRAVTEDGEEPWHGWPPGEKPESEDGTVHLPPTGVRIRCSSTAKSAGGGTASGGG